jgi:acetyl-CoA synthetase
VKSGLINKSQYQNKYTDSIKNNNAFWKKEGKRISWIKPYKKIKQSNNSW